MSKIFEMFSKLGNQKSNKIKISVLGGIASFLVPLFILLAVVAYLLGVVQENVERVENLVKGGCILCTNEELAQMKEDQFKTKLNIIGDVFGERVDKVVLASTVLFQGDYYENLDAQYDKKFDEQDFLEKVRDLAASFSVTGDKEYDGITQREIDTLDAALIIMVNSNEDGKYNEEKYKQALMDSGFGSDVAIVNGAACVLKSAWDSTLGVINSLPLINYFTQSGNLVDAGDRVAVTVNICRYGFIGGTFDDVFEMQSEYDTMAEGDEKEAQEQKILKKKKEIVKNIIDFADFYKFLFPQEEDSCTYASTTGTGDMTNWRQSDERWGSMRLGIGDKTVAQAGCTSTSMAYLIAKSGTKLTTPSIDPGVFVQNAKYTSDSNLYWDSWTDMAPNFKMVRQGVSVNINNAASVLSTELNTPCGDNDNNQRFIVLYLSLGHWIAVDHVENGTVYVMDPSHPQSGLAKIEDTKKGHSLYSYNSFCAYDVAFGTTGSSSTSSSANLDYNSDEYQRRLSVLPRYHQGDAGSEIGDIPVGNSSMRWVGCGTASLMAAHYMYTGEDFDNVQFVNDTIKEGFLTEAGGVSSKFDTPESSPYITSQWGLYGQAIDVNMDTILDTLKGGKKVLCLIQGNSSAVYPTTAGHYILLDHYSEAKKEIYVFDPNPNGNTSGMAREGYLEVSYLNKYLMPYLVKTQAISSNRANGNYSCSKYGNGDLDTLKHMLGTLEGMLTETCTVRGKSGYVARKIKEDMVDVGNSTAYGITQYDGVAMADEVGYTTFYEDMGNGCVEQSYIEEMADRYMETEVEDVRQYYEKVSGGKRLEEYQYHALALIHHHWPVGSHRLIDELAKLSDVRSYEAYKLFLKYNGLGGSYGGILRREVEFHLFYNGNYNADRDFSYSDISYYWTKEYYNERVKIYKSE